MHQRECYLTDKNIGTFKLLKLERELKLNSVCAVIVAHLVNRVLLTPEICSSNPVYLLSIVLQTVFKR